MVTGNHKSILPKTSASCTQESVVTLSGLKSFTSLTEVCKPWVDVNIGAFVDKSGRGGCVREGERQGEVIPATTSLFPDEVDLDAGG